MVSIWTLVTPRSHTARSQLCSDRGPSLALASLLPSLPSPLSPCSPTHHHPCSFHPCALLWAEGRRKLSVGWKTEALPLAWTVLESDQESYGSAWNLTLDKEEWLDRTCWRQWCEKQNNFRSLHLLSPAQWLQCYKWFTYPSLASPAFKWPRSVLFLCASQPTTPALASLCL